MCSTGADKLFGFLKGFPLCGVRVGANKKPEELEPTQATRRSVVARIPVGPTSPFPAQLATIFSMTRPSTLCPAFRSLMLSTSTDQAICSTIHFDTRSSGIALATSCSWTGNTGGPTPSATMEMALQRTTERQVGFCQICLASSSCILWHTISIEFCCERGLQTCLCPPSLLAFNWDIRYWASNLFDCTQQVIPCELFTKSLQNRLPSNLADKGSTTWSEFQDSSNFFP